MRKFFLILSLAGLLLAVKAAPAVAQIKTPDQANALVSNPYITVNKDIYNYDCFQSVSLTVMCDVDSSGKPMSTADKILAAASDMRVRKLRAYFEKHKSPLAPYAYDFVYYADQYGLDWKLVPAISGVESTFGKHIPYNSYNAYGWANGDYKFTSWSNSIEHVTRTLRTKYYDRGLDTVPKIARVYAPPSKTWGNNVNFFMTKIDSFELPSEI